MKYKCIRKCHWKGKKWIEGDVVELSETPPHHFISADKSEKSNVILNKPSDDPLKQKVANNSESYFEASLASPVASGGFASSLQDSKPISNPKDYKKK